MLDESQGLLQEGNLSRYSGPLSVCVPLVHSCICLPLGGASPQDGHLYRPPHCWSLIRIESNRLGPSHLRPPHLPLTRLYLFLCGSNVPCLYPLNPPHFPLSSTLTLIFSAHPLCYPNQAPSPFYKKKKMLKRVSEPLGPGSSASVLSLLAVVLYS